MEQIEILMLAFNIILGCTIVIGTILMGIHYLISKIKRK